QTVDDTTRRAQNQALRPISGTPFLNFRVPFSQLGVHRGWRPPPAFSVPVVGAARRGGVQALLDQRANLVRILRIAVGTGGRVYGAGGGFWAVYVRLRAVGGLLCLNLGQAHQALGIRGERGPVHTTHPGHLRVGRQVEGFTPPPRAAFGGPAAWPGGPSQQRQPVVLRTRPPRHPRPEGRGE